MDILYQTKDIVVCIKPVGVDSEKGMPGLLAEALGGSFYPVHRLDQGVGGLMVFARSPKAAAELSALIAQGQLSKEYLALVHGCPEDTEGRMEDLLWKDSRKNKVYVVSRQRAGVKKAALRYRVLRKGEKSLVRVYLETGRSHQIRVQFASRGMPLVGERKYSTLEDPCEIALWSYRLGFAHPATGEHMEFCKEPPEDFPWTVFTGQTPGKGPI